MKEQMSIENQRTLALTVIKEQTKHWQKFLFLNNKVIITQL